MNKKRKPLGRGLKNQGNKEELMPYDILYGVWTNKIRNQILPDINCN